ncbi:MAG: T9SS type A sorting domain-containing protein [Bacteroidota bacterium]
MVRNLYILILFFFISISAVSAQSEFNASFGNEIELEEIYNNIKVFPNPAQSYFSVSENNVVLQVEVYNLLGRKLKSFKMEAGMKYDVSDLNKGMYLVRLLDSKEKVVKTLRLQKE